MNVWACDLCESTEDTVDRAGLCMGCDSSICVPCAEAGREGFCEFCVEDADE